MKVKFVGFGGYMETPCYEDENGNYVSTIPDEELGKFVYACLWHPLDNVYHYSDRFKNLFKSNWNKECE